MLAMYPAQIYIVFKNIFGGELNSSTFNHYLHGHAKFWKQKILQQRLARYPTYIDSLGLNGIFFKKLLKSFWPMYLPPGS